MTYFCAKCQKRHPASDISGDMWGICRKDIASGIKSVISRMREENSSDKEITGLLADFEDAMTGFVNDMDSSNPDASGSMQNQEEKQKLAERSEAVRTTFALDRKAMKALIGARKNGRIITGTYRITLGQIYRLYVEQDKDQQNAGMISRISARNWNHWFDETVCDKDIKVFLDERGYVDKVTDFEDVPFTVDGEKVGFRRICPHCGRVLSRVAGCAEEIVVALVGSPRAGKTSCMVAMIGALLDQNCKGVSIQNPGNDETMEAVYEEVNMHKLCKKVIKTDTFQSSAPTYSVLLNMDDGSNTQKVLTIVDMPGEFWQGDEGLGDEFFRQYTALYQHTDCMWFVISKQTVRLAQAEITDELNEKLLKNTSEDRKIIKQSDPINLEKNLRELKKHLESNNSQVPPMLVVVTKPDEAVSDNDWKATAEYSLFPLPPKQDEVQLDSQGGGVAEENSNEIARAVKSGSHNFGGIIEKHMYHHSENVRSYIATSNAQFLGAIENTCDNRFYMSVSAYGQVPLERNAKEGRIPTPYHELYPLFWTLMITGAGKVYHQCQWQTMGLLGGISSTDDREEGIRFSFAQKNSVLDQIANRQKRKDYETFYRDIESNLMMHKNKYTKSVIKHKRG